MEQGKTELFSGLQLDEQQCSWSPSKTTKGKNSTEQTELESRQTKLNNTSSSVIFVRITNHASFWKK